MTTQTSQGVAGRLGYGFGRGVRFFLYDQNPTLRWVKRLILVSVVLLLSMNLASWFVGAFMGLLTIGLVFFVLSKGELGNRSGMGSIHRGGEMYEHSIVPNPGDYDHPDYSLNYED